MFDFSVEFFSGKTVLVTGGTGTFGRAFSEFAIKHLGVAKLIIVSRDEMKQWEMAQEFSDSRVRFLIGDVRDHRRLLHAFRGVDIVVHAAATKIVPTAEYDPFECCKTNVQGAMNVIDAAIERGVGTVVALSTDKASSPVNLYGATKLVSDRLFVASNLYGGGGTVFSVVRYGNVMGSRGSVIPLFKKQKNDGLITVTHPGMTRFALSIEEAVSLVLSAAEHAIGGEIFVPKIPSIKILDLIQSIAPGVEIKTIGIRPGEKMHEEMIGVHDAPNTFEYSSLYKILPSINSWREDEKRIGDGKLVGDKFCYTSESNNEWLVGDELTGWLFEKGLI